MSTDETRQVQALLERMRHGDEAAREQLIDFSCERLRRLARKMLRGYPRLRRWEETDDIFQSAVFRLHRSLSDVQPASPAHFFALASTQIRRTLLDLARHHFGPEGSGAHHHTDHHVEERLRSIDRAADPGEPQTIDEWTEFHDQVELLPEREREVFQMLWYGGLTQAEAADILECDVRTIKRRWQSARIMLFEALGEKGPPA